MFESSLASESTAFSISLPSYTSSVLFVLLFQNMDNRRLFRVVNRGAGTIRVLHHAGRYLDVGSEVSSCFRRCVCFYSYLAHEIPYSNSFSLL